MTREEELKKILEEFESLSDVVGSAIVRRDGLMILSGLPNNVNRRGVAAMTAAIVGTGETASKELNMGKLRQVIVESEMGKLVSTGAGETSILTALVRENANMGLVLLEMEKAAKKISRILG